jgi:hypothetical protein
VFWLAMFILLEWPSPLRRIFIDSHSLPSPLVTSFGPSSGFRSSYGSVRTLTCLRSKDYAPVTGLGPPHFNAKNYQMRQRQMLAFLRKVKVRSFGMSR